MSLEHAVLAWLKAQQAAAPADSEKRDGLEVVVQCFSDAFGIAEGASAGRYELSQMWNTGVSLMKAEEAKQVRVFVSLARAIPQQAIVLRS